jgi:hypothetical protein
VRRAGKMQGFFASSRDFSADDANADDARPEAQRPS